MIAGGTGSIAGTCNDGKWDNVVVDCRPTPIAKKSCAFVGGTEGTACTFAAVQSAHGVRTSASVIAGGTGSIAGTCNDGKWDNVVVDCRPTPIAKKSCFFGGGTEGSACTFGAVIALDGVRASAPALAGGTGSIAGTCNDGKWESVVLDCH